MMNLPPFGPPFGPSPAAAAPLASTVLVVDGSVVIGVVVLLLAIVAGVLCSAAVRAWRRTARRPRPGRARAPQVAMPYAQAGPSR
jgi:hypothetical protein